MLKRLLISLSMLTFLFVIHTQPVEAASDNYTLSVPKVLPKDNQALGTLIIKEDPDSDGFFAVNQLVTITLPNGVKYMEVPTVGDVVYANGLNHYIDTTDTGFDWEIVAAGDNYLTVKAIGGGSSSDEEKLKFCFCVQDYSKVSIDHNVTGDIKIEIDAAGTPITSEYVTVGRVINGDTTTTVSDIKTIKPGKTANIGTIKINEALSGWLKASNDDYIKLTLPSGYKWVKDSRFEIFYAQLQAKVVSGWNSNVLSLEITKASISQPGFIALSGLMVSVPSDTSTDELMITVSGNNAKSEDVVIAKLVKESSTPTVTASVYGPREVGLKWEPVDGETVGYQVLRGIPSLPGYFYNLGTVPVDINSFTDDSVLPNTSYTYAVCPIGLQEYYRFEYTLTTVVTPDESTSGNNDDDDDDNDNNNSNGGDDSKDDSSSSSEKSETTEPTEEEASSLKTTFRIGDKVMLINGSPKPLNLAPEIKNGRTMVPLRALSEALGAEVQWDPKTQTITVVKRQDK